jgi:hypothetical protein
VILRGSVRVSGKISKERLALTDQVGVRGDQAFLCTRRSGLGPGEERNELIVEGI